MTFSSVCCMDLQERGWRGEGEDQEFWVLLENLFSASDTNNLY